MIRWFAPLMLLAAAPAPTDRADLATKLELLADTGSIEAQYHLGMMRHLGLGGAKDHLAAFGLFQKAADAGDPLAAYMLGSYYLGLGGVVTEPDKPEALKWKLVAAEAGYALAQHDVARLYFEADDTDAALEWLTRAAQQGEVNALRALASLHNSDAIPRDAARTFAYYTLAMKQTAEPTQKQRDWIAEFTAKMSDEDKARGEKIVAGWKIEPTPLTLKAQSGLRAAEAVVNAMRPPSIKKRN
jgi:uncharacterized protein